MTEPLRTDFNSYDKAARRLRRGQRHAGHRRRTGWKNRSAAADFEATRAQAVRFRIVGNRLGNQAIRVDTAGAQRRAVHLLAAQSHGPRRSWCQWFLTVNAGDADRSVVNNLHCKSVSAKISRHTKDRVVALRGGFLGHREKAAQNHSFLRSLSWDEFVQRVALLEAEAARRNRRWGPVARRW